jgi:hypothetical protein
MNRCRDRPNQTTLFGVIAPLDRAISSAGQEARWTVFIQQVNFLRSHRNNNLPPQEQTT